jgi:hypothetical protein
VEAFALAGPLPPPAAEISWSAAMANHTWKSLGNKTTPDCTVACACHMMMAWTANSKGKPWDFYWGDAVADYLNYKNPGSGGADIQNILSNWQTLGIHRRLGSQTVAETITHYAGLDLSARPQELIKQVKLSIQLLGGCCIGVVLPKFAVYYNSGDPNPHGSKPDWHLTEAAIRAKGATAAKDPKAGHCVAAVGYTTDAIEVVTWGSMTRMSWDFYLHYTDESWAVLCPTAWAKADGSTPSGLTRAQLDQDFAAIQAAGNGRG